jgi:tetratricopeptide (TPR) repeat protein
MVGLRAARANDWATVNACARDILRQDSSAPDGWFLQGLVSKAAGLTDQAIDAFATVLELDHTRYDAAIELAWQYWAAARPGKAWELLRDYRAALANSPIYLELAARTYSRLGLHKDAYAMLLRASQLQPNIGRFQEQLAASAVILGKIDEARQIYQSLLAAYPHHQRNHFELSRLQRATDDSHIRQMKETLAATDLPAERNIFLHYAIAKELEDLEDWDEAFHHYKLAGDAAHRAAHDAGYRVSQDLAVIDKIMEVCTIDWLGAAGASDAPDLLQRTPVFVVGLPRTGTTLVERILSSHSRVESVDETTYLPLAIRQAGGRQGGGAIDPEIIEVAAKAEPELIARSYLGLLEYRLGSSPLFIEKLPENILYLGYIARSFPRAKIVHLQRHPMDACFAMYKQSYFRFAYSLDDIGQYYLAYHRLSRYWDELLKDRIIKVQYEELVNDLEQQSSILLEMLDLEFEPACVDFHLNRQTSATASAAQVREKAHTRSVNKWRNWERQLQPLRRTLEDAGICVD